VKVFTIYKCNAEEKTIIKWKESHCENFHNSEAMRERRQKQSEKDDIVKTFTIDKDATRRKAKPRKINQNYENFNNNLLIINL
jgi:hypothetical protein